MSHFNERKHDDSEVVISAHQHVDNGGHTVSVDRFKGVIIESGFYGYSHTVLYLSSVDIDGLIKLLQESKNRISEIEVVERLKGNL